MAIAALMVGDFLDGKGWGCKVGFNFVVSWDFLLIVGNIGMVVVVVGG